MQASSRSLLVSSAVANAVVAVLTYAVLGWNSAGAHAGARNTARLSALIFIVGFAQPGLMRIWHQLPSSADLVQAFVSAHLVHFAAVILMVALDTSHFLRHFSVGGVLVVTIGLSVTLAAGLTARSTGALRIANEVVLYALFAILFADYLQHPVKLIRSVAVLLGLALVVRIAGQFTRPRAKVAASAAG
jgi:hypothetical protein